MRTHFTLGLVGAPFGLKGFVKLKSFSGETGHFFRLGKVTLKMGEKEEAREIAEIVPQGASLLIRFEGINSPEAAGLLNGAEIIAGREYAAPLNEGEYYIEDLKGLEVMNGAGHSLGHIADIIEGGGGELAELRLHSGEKRLVPFRNEFFGDIDLENRKIELLVQWILD